MELGGTNALAKILCNVKVKTLYSENVYYSQDLDSDSYSNQGNLKSVCISPLDSKSNTRIHHMAMKIFCHSMLKI